MVLSVPMLTVLRHALLQAGEDHVDLAAPDWWWLHSLHHPRMGPCSRTWTFPANDIDATGLHHPSVLMTMMTSRMGIVRLPATAIRYCASVTQSRGRQAKKWLDNIKEVVQHTDTADICQVTTAQG